MTEIFDLTFEQTPSAVVSAPIERSEWWLHPLLSLLGCVIVGLPHPSGAYSRAARRPPHRPRSSSTPMPPAARAATFNYSTASTLLSYPANRGEPHPLLEDKVLVHRDSPAVKSLRGFIDIDVPPAPASAEITVAWLCAAGS